MKVAEILIADDHELFRRTLRSFLEAHTEWRVCGEAGDGLEAVEKTKQLRPAIILMDINMPRMDGLEATRIIGREVPESKVIILTQNHASIARQQAALVNAAAYATKSDLTTTLPATIAKLLETGKAEAVKDAAQEAPFRHEWLQGGGVLGQLIDKFDWRATPLGPIDAWPPSLRSVLRVVLTSRFAMWMGWGPELTFLYNDAYAKMTLGNKHPWALGKRSEQVWEEVWNDIGPRIRKVLESGEATWDEALQLFLERSGYPEETYHTFSYSPLFGDDGKTAGHLCVVTEETDRVISERRLGTLRSLSGELNRTVSEKEVFVALDRCLGENQKDLPFSLVYLFTDDLKRARLVCRNGISANHPAAPAGVDLKDSHVWPLGYLLQGRDSVLVEDLPGRFDFLPSGYWDRPPSRAIIVPITSQAQEPPAGVLVAALNPYRPLNVSYAGFINLLAGQIAASVSSARAYEAERKRAEALAEIDRAKTTFFSNVSHEFRTPLTLMLAPLEDLLARGHADLSPAAKGQLELVNRNGIRLLRLVNTLLDFSRIEAGRIQASYEPIDLAEFTIELASVFRSAVERAGLRFSVDCPSLPQSVYVDRDMWEKIVLNLLSNAFKFTFDGEITLTLRTRTRSGGDANGVYRFAELRVSDTGVGIPEQEIPRVFERFHRVESAKSRTHEGTGIGLALVQELVKLHGGKIRVESVLGTGTSFAVTIPFGNDHLPPDRIGAKRTLSSTGLGALPFVEEALRWLPESTPEVPQELPSPNELLPVPSRTTELPASRPSVLVVDDNLDMRQYFARLLAERYQVETAPDGTAAIEAVRRRAPDLILSDVMMPKLDGFGLLQKLRADIATSDIPIILVSARAGEEARLEGLEHGADDYLIKPFSARELLARVEAHLKLSQLRSTAEQALKDSEARLKLFIEYAPAAIAMFDREMRYLAVSRRWLSDYGLSEDVVGRSHYEVFPELPEPWKEGHRRCLAGATERRDEEEFTRPDGSVRWISSEVHPWYASPDEIGGIIIFAEDVTEIRRSQLQMIKMQARLDFVLDRAEVGYWDWDLNANQLEWSSTCKRLFGIREDEKMSYHRFLVALHPEDRRRTDDAVHACLEGGGHADYDVDFRVNLPQGNTRWVRAKGNAVFVDGKASRMAGIAIDVTARNLTEQALRNSEERFRAFVTASTDVVYTMSPNWEEMRYLRGKDFIADTEQPSRNWLERYVPPEEQERVLTAIREAIRTKSKFELQHRIWLRDGSVGWTLSRAIPILDRNGEITEWFGAASDMTARKSTEEELQKAQYKFKRLVESNVVPIVSANLQGITEANDAFLEFIGYTREELVQGKIDWIKLTPPEYLTQGMKGLAELKSKGFSQPFETEYIRKDGTRVHFMIGAVALNAAPLEWLSVIVDLSALKRVEAELRNYHKELETIVAQRTAEVSAANAQLRALTARLLQAQDEERRRIARDLHDSAGQLLAALGIILAQMDTRGNGSSPEVLPEVNEAQTLVQQLSNEIRTTSYLLHPPLLDERGLPEALRICFDGVSKRSGLKIDFQISDHLERLPAEIELSLFRVAQEALTNILRHSGSTRAEIRLVRESTAVTLEIRDGGRGMPAELLHKLQTGGPGVGIAGMRERLHQLRGEMDIQSGTWGTHVTARVPIAERPTAPPLTGTEPSPTEA